MNYDWRLFKNLKNKIIIRVKKAINLPLTLLRYYYTIALRYIKRRIKSDYTLRSVWPNNEIDKKLEIYTPNVIIYNKVYPFIKKSIEFETINGINTRSTL